MTRVTMYYDLNPKYLIYRTYFLIRTYFQQLLNEAE